MDENGVQKNKYRHTSFKDVWRKAIEKYSPRKPTKLNEVSYRFQQMLEEARKANQTKSEKIAEESKKKNTLKGPS